MPRDYRVKPASRDFPTRVTTLRGNTMPIGSLTYPDTGSSVVTQVVVSPSSFALASNGNSIALTADPRNSNGQTVLGKTVSWSTNAPTVISFSGASGYGVTVTRLSGGSATVFATVDGVQGQATLANNSSLYPNEPIDFTLLAELRGTSLPPTSPSSTPAGWTNEWGSTGLTYLSLVNDPTNPLGESSVLAIKFPGPGDASYPTGFPAGIGPCNIYTGWGGSGPNDIGECSELYICYIFKIHGAGDGFYENQIAGTKNGFWSGPNTTTAENDFIMMTAGTGVTGLYSSFNTELRTQNISAQNRGRNIGSGHTLFVGTWHTLEMYCRVNDMDVNNGLFKFWVDGVLYGDWNDIKYRGETSTVRATIISVTNPTTFVVGSNTLTVGMDVGILNGTAYPARGRVQVTSITPSGSNFIVEVDNSVSGMQPGDVIRQSFARKFVSYKMAPTWGGTGGPNKTRDDFVYFNRIHVSGKP